jgi:hypothetical protein
MTSERDFDALLRSWFDESAPSGPPQGLLPSVQTVTAHTRPRPAWLVRLGGEPMPEPGSSGLNRFAPLALAATAIAVALLIGIGLFVRLTNVGPSPVPGPTHNSSARWTGTGSMVVARSGHTATLLPDGKVLVAGGFDVTKAPGVGGSPQIVATAELYDPSTGTWSATGSMIETRQGHTATRLTNGTVLVVGGYRNAIPGRDERGPEPLNTAELFDPGTGTWSATGSMSSPFANHGAALLPTGKVLVEYGDFFIFSAELYDPSAEKWTAIWSPDIGGFVAATLLADGTVLTTFELRDTALFDPATESWTYMSGSGIFGAGGTATLLDDGTVLVAGGSTVSAAGGTATVESWRQAELYHPGSPR